MDAGNKLLTPQLEMTNRDSQLSEECYDFSLISFSGEDVVLEEGRGVASDKEGKMEEVVTQNIAQTERKPTWKSKVYSDEQLELFFRLLDKGSTVKEAAIKAGINVSTAYAYRRKYESEGPPQKNNVFSSQSTEEKNSILNDEHSQFLIDFVDKNLSTALVEAKDDLCSAFEGLSISTPAFSKHMNEKCALSLKKADKTVEELNTDDIVEERKETALRWKEDKDMDFASNCIFLDEAGFVAQVSCTDSIKPVILDQTESQITVFGAISGAGVINVSKRELTTTVMETSIYGEEQKVTRPVSKSEGFATFVNIILDFLEGEELKSQYFLMDSASVDDPARLCKMIENRGQQCVYLPPSLSFLNPVEKLWSKMRMMIKRHPLDENDELQSRFAAAAEQVRMEDCQDWIQNSISLLDKCIAEDPDL